MPRSQPRVLLLALATLLLPCICGAAAPAPAAPLEATASSPSMERIQRIVSRSRDLLFRAPVTEERFSREDFCRKERDSAWDRREELKGQESFLKKLGLIPADADLVASMSSQKGDCVSGYYDTETKAKVFVRDDLEDEERTSVLAHELSHVLQDQHFGLDEYLKRTSPGDFRNGDAEMARLALIEGEASALMLSYLFWEKDVEFTVLSNPVACRRSLEAELERLYPEKRRLPDALCERFNFPYVYGLNFIREIRREHPWRRIAEMYGDPPSSTEQIIHPERYLERDAPSRVDLPDYSETGGFGLSRKYDDTLGEFMVYVLLSRQADPATAYLASVGWDGDRAALYEDSQGAHHLFWLTTWDARKDAEEFFWAFRQALGRKLGAEGTVEDGEPRMLVWSTPGGTELLELRGNDVLHIASALPRGKVELLRTVSWAFAAKARPEAGTALGAPAEVGGQAFFRRAMEIKSRFEYNAEPDLRVAEELLRKAVELDPSCVPCLVELADIITRTSGRGQEVIQQSRALVERAEKLDPSSPEVLRLRAYLGHATRSYGQAEADIRKALAADATNPRYYKILGEILREKGDGAAAVEAWKQGLEQQGPPHVIAALSSLVAGWEKDVAKRLRLLGRALDLDPNPARRYSYAKCQLDGGQFEDAIYSTSQTLKERLDSRAFLVRGRARQALGDQERADRDFALAAETGSFFEVVELFIKEGRDEKAAEVEASVEKERQLGGSFHLKLGEVYARAGKLDEAVTRFQRAVEDDPELGEAYHHMARIYDKRADKGKAEEAFMKAASVKEPRPRACYEAGLFLARLGKYKEAYGPLKKATELGDEASYWLDLGRLCEDYLNRHEEAITHFLKVIDLKPDHADVYYSLGRAYANINDYARSAAVWAKYLELAPEGKFSSAIRQRIGQPPWSNAVPKQ